MTVCMALADAYAIKACVTDPISSDLQVIIDHPHTPPTEPAVSAI